jgi:transcriptional regulator with XRE-family HTH domain
MRICMQARQWRFMRMRIPPATTITYMPRETRSPADPVFDGVRALVRKLDDQYGQKALAKMLGFDQGTISRAKNGETVPSTSFLLALLQYAETPSLDALLGLRPKLRTPEDYAEIIVSKSLDKFAGALPKLLPSAPTTLAERMPKEPTARDYMGERLAAGDESLRWSDVLLRRVEKEFGAESRLERHVWANVFRIIQENAEELSTHKKKRAQHEGRQAKRAARHAHESETHAARRRRGAA